MHTTNFLNEFGSMDLVLELLPEPLLELLLELLLLLLLYVPCHVNIRGLKALPL